MELVPKPVFHTILLYPPGLYPNVLNPAQVCTQDLNIYLKAMLVTVFMFVLDTNPYRKLALKNLRGQECLC